MEEFEQFHAGMTTHYAPVGETETYFVNEIIDNAWRLRRAHRIEAETFDRHCSEELSEGEAFHVHAKEFDRVRRYVTGIERAMYKAIRQLDTIQGARYDAEASEAEFVSQNLNPTATALSAPTASTLFAPTASALFVPSRDREGAGMDRSEPKEASHPYDTAERQAA